MPVRRDETFAVCTGGRRRGGRRNAGARRQRERGCGLGEEAKKLPASRHEKTASKRMPGSAADCGRRRPPATDSTIVSAIGRHLASPPPSPPRHTTAAVLPRPLRSPPPPSQRSRRRCDGSCSGGGGGRSVRASAALSLDSLDSTRTRTTLLVDNSTSLFRYSSAAPVRFVFRIRIRRSCDSES